MRLCIYFSILASILCLSSCSCESWRQHRREKSIRIGQVYEFDFEGRVCRRKVVDVRGGFLEPRVIHHSEAEPPYQPFAVPDRAHLFLESYRLVPDPARP